MIVRRRPRGLEVVVLGVAAFFPVEKVLIVVLIVLILVMVLPPSAASRTLVVTAKAVSQVKPNNRSAMMTKMKNQVPADIWMGR